MVTRKESATKKPDRPVKERQQRQSRPATTPEAREMQLVSLAISLAEKQLMDGTASPSVINHFLKIGSTREAIEKELLLGQSKLVESKAQSLDKDRQGESVAKAAMDAMKTYSPQVN